MKRIADSLQTTAALPGASVELASDVVAIAPELVAQIEAHAWSTYPRECCGILVGLAGSPTEICTVRPTENKRAARGHDRYEIDPREILWADHAAEAEGKQIAGFYHSHPNYPARPSATDREFAWSGYIYLIVSVHGPGETRLTAWSFDEGSQQFHERPLELCAHCGETSPGRPGRLTEQGG